MVISLFAALVLASIVSSNSLNVYISIGPISSSDYYYLFILLIIYKALSTRIEPGLEQQIVLPRDSYLQVYTLSHSSLCIEHQFM